jgi:multiple sugar transport system permease protein
VKRRDGRAAWLFLGPAVAHLAVFAAFPIVFSFVLAFYDWRILEGGSKFVGFGQFQAVLADGPFWNAVMNSVRYAAMSVPLGMLLALGVAALVARPLRGMAFFRTLFYAPSVVSGVAVAMVWIYVYLPEKGLLNSLLGLFGAPGVDVLNEPSLAMPGLALMGAVVGLGPRMVVYVAALLSVPPALEEAASLDGAGPLRRFVSVTLPMIAPTSLFVLVTSTIGSLQLFTPVYLMTKGGPLNTTDVAGYHVYTTAWQRFEVSLASAQACFLLVVVAVVTAVQMRLARRTLEGWSPG